MEPLYPVFAAVVLFLAAAFGLMMVFLRASGKPLPLPLGVVHGVLALGGLALLALYLSVARWSALLTASAVFFLLAALLGVGLFRLHLRGRLHPLRWIVLHGAIAFLALVFLLLHVSRA